MISVDLLVVGAGPTGIAIGVEARRAGLRSLLVDRGPLVAHLLEFPTFMRFFTTRERLEIGDIPFAVPEEKPSRRQAVVYYQAVAARYELELALYEEVERIEPHGDAFRVHSRTGAGARIRRAHAVAIASGYFGSPRRLGVEGEDLPWVHARYKEPYAHFGQPVVVVGGGNSAVEAALDLWRSGARVTIVHRGSRLKPSLKYWLAPDIENRIAEGSIAARLETRVRAFETGGVRVESDGSPAALLPAAAAYVLIGYEPDPSLQRDAGVEVDPETLVPAFDPETCESNVPGLYIAGTLQAGIATDVIFIENSRDHGRRIARHLRRRLRGAPALS